jgi:hypothetical protein
MRTVDEERRNVETQWQELLAFVLAAQPRPLAAVEAGVWTRLLGLGRGLIGLYFARQAGRLRTAQYKREGVAYDLQGTTTTEIGTRFGKVEFTRAVGRPVGKRPGRGRRDLPVDRELGVTAGFSLPVTLVIARFCAQMAFGMARATFESVFEWAPCSRTVSRIVDSVGKQATDFLAQTPAPEDDGEILVIQADAKGIPMISSAEYRRRCEPRKAPGHATKRRARRLRRRDVPRRRRKPRDKSKNAKMAVVGVIYTLRRQPDGTLEGPINKRVIATFGTHRALFKLLRREADKRGYGTKRTAFLADGAKTLWKLQEEFFPAAEGCIDWFHTVEKLYTCAECVHPQDLKARAAWIDEQTRLLRRRGAGPVIENLGTAFDAIPKTGPGNKNRRARLLRTRKHLLDHMQHMRYAQFRRDDLDIGTGAVEGAVRNVVGMRLDGPGMRWSRDRAQRVLHLRCILINGQWQDFERYIEGRTEIDALRLAARPKPTLPHDAIPKTLKRAA